VDANQNDPFKDISYTADERLYDLLNIRLDNIARSLDNLTDSVATLAMAVTRGAFLVGAQREEAPAEEAAAQAAEPTPARPAAVAVQPVPEPKPEAEAAAPVTLEAVVAAAQAMVHARGTAPLTAILAGFDLKRVSLCPEERRAELLTAILSASVAQA
jgi:hypothetical protein